MVSILNYVMNKEPKMPVGYRAHGKTVRRKEGRRHVRAPTYREIGVKIETICSDPLSNIA